LTDGPFTVLDLEGIGRSPSVIVLSACDLGSADVKVGDDLLGLSEAIFVGGVRLLVAALVPVEDRATRTLMVAMHAALVDEATVAGTLRPARSAVWDVDVAHRAAASFTCFGAG
jgi:CHAT domain-containing protein